MIFNFNLAFLMVVQLTVVRATSSESWGTVRVRYDGSETSLGTDSSLTAFDVGETVVLSYVGDVNYTASAANAAALTASLVVWSVDGVGSVCTLDAQTGSLVRLTCSESGERKVQVTRVSPLFANVTDTFFISFASRLECYRWHHVFTSNGNVLPALPVDSSHSSTGVTSVQLRVWVSDARTKETGAVPSVIASPLTGRYSSLGEQPYVSMKGAIVPSFASTAMTFNSSASFWYIDFALPSTGFYTTVDIFGEGISSLGCTVANMTDNPLDLSKYRLVAASTASSTSVNTTAFALQHDSCAPSIVVIPTTTHVLLSEDYLASFTFLQVATEADALKAVVATPSNLVILKSSGAYTLNQTASATLVASNFSSGGLISFPTDVDSLRGQGSCDVLATRQNTFSPSNFYVSAWGRTNGTVVFVSSDGGVSFSGVDLPQQFGTISRVHSVEYSPSRYDVIAVVTSTSSDFLLLRQRISGVWLQGHVFDSSTGRLTGVKTSDAHVVNAVSGSGELFFAADELFYSPDGGISADKITFRNRDPSRAPSGALFGLGAREYVRQVATHSKGGFAAFTSFSRLFYGVATSSVAMELQSGVAANAIASLMFRSPHSLYVVSADNATAVTRRLYPLSMELLGTKAPAAFNPVASQRCPFDAEDVSVNISRTELVYMDMQDTIDIGAYITGNVSSPNFMSFSVSDISLLALSSVTTTTRAPLETSKLLYSRTVSVRESPLTYANRQARLDAAQGVASLRTAPTSTNALCRTPQQTKPIRVGCPPNRHIRVRDAVCDNWTPSEATLRAISIDGENAEYSFAVYGCQIRIFHGTKGWKPTVDLYDGNTFVRQVSADFVIWEVQGRKDFSYNASASRAGCISQPATWDSLMEGRAYGSPSQDALWTPENQVNCFAADASRPLGSSSYDIMNSTGPNYLLFDPTGNDGLFLFKLRVVDPGFSFCDLTTHFALDVYGAPLDTVTTIIIVMSVTAVFVVALGVSYLYYRQKMQLKKDV